MVLNVRATDASGHIEYLHTDVVWRNTLLTMSFVVVPSAFVCLCPHSRELAGATTINSPAHRWGGPCLHVGVFRLSLRTHFAWSLATDAIAPPISCLKFCRLLLFPFDQG
jgi:hypothetical protein